MPLIWNARVSHLLGDNFALAKRILASQIKKLDSKQIGMINDVFLEQINMGIIKKVDNIESIIGSGIPYSYLAHMPVFRLDKPSSPCRVVFLSNLNGKGASVISHNQAMLAGPPLNRKLTTALLGLRFNKYVLCFDLKKAFLQIELSEDDQKRLLFLWYKDVTKGDYSLVTYKNVRLSFGLRCSPTILMLGLYKILIIDTDHDDAETKVLKRQIYHLIYVDNGSISCNDPKELVKNFNKLDKIFNPYKFELQQYVTNNTHLQSAIDDKEQVTTEEETKLLGVRWNRLTDNLSTKPMKLNEKANTKRQILKSIAENFDPEGYNLPILNRARLFMHRLQLMSSLGWDTVISDELHKEWVKISNQVNGGKSLDLPRYIGDMSHDYELVGFTDSSKQLYGVVVYLYNKTENTVSFVRAKNRVINKQLKLKSIPTLEFQALSFGAEVILEVYQELTGPDCVEVINIHNVTIYTDSYVALNWLNNYDEMKKLRNLSIFTINRLNKIINLCITEPITFKFVAGHENPSDYVTRECSEKILRETNYLTGPKFLKEPNKYNSDMIEVRIPNTIAELCKKEFRIDQGPGLVGCEEIGSYVGIDTYEKQLERFSKFKSLINSYVGQYRFINNIRKKLKAKNPAKYEHVNIIPEDELRPTAMRLILKYDQLKWYTDVFEYFKTKNKVAIKDIPPIITQLNLAMDSFDLIRVKSKLYPRLSDKQDYVLPILISPKSRLAELVINEYHEKLGHADRFTVLSEIRKKIWIPKAFCLIRNLTSRCLICKRLHGRTIRLNKNCYRYFRSSPESVPFKNVFLDYLGPFEVRINESPKIKNKDRKKIWVLVVCCLWSRAVKLHICYDYSGVEFVKALQKQIFESGVPSLCISDSGTPLVGGAKKINKYIFNNHLVQEFFREQSITSINFQSYPKGNHSLGGLVECCNRMVRKLIFGSIRNLVLSLSDIHFVLVKVCSILNKRPLVLKETLRNSDIEVPDIITPEMLMYGRPLSYLNIIPETYPSDVLDINIEDIDYAKELSQLQKVSKRLNSIYEDYFLQQLIIQSTNKRGGFKPVVHKKLKLGDLVLIKDELTKPHQYPLGRIIELIQNSMGEITEVKLIKGNREVIRRHVFSIIPLLSLCNDDEDLDSNNKSRNMDESKSINELKPPARKAAVKGLEKIKSGYRSGNL